MIRTAILSALNKQNHANITLRDILHLPMVRRIRKKGTDEGSLNGPDWMRSLAQPSVGGMQYPITRPINRACLTRPAAV
jgi:hypothetical protein